MGTSRWQVEGGLLPRGSCQARNHIVLDFAKQKAIEEKGTDIKTERERETDRGLLPVADLSPWQVIKLAVEYEAVLVITVRSTTYLDEYFPSA